MWLRRWNLAANATAAMFLLTEASAVDSAEIRVISSGGVRQPLQDIFREFERASGNKVVPRFEFGAVVIRQIETGAAFDVAISSVDLADLVRQGKIAPGTRVVLGRTGVGIGVRRGMSKPDISTTEAFKRALLNSKSVAYAREGGSGLYFTGLLDRLGISENMKPKLKPYEAGDAVEAVARGDAEMVVNGTVPILSVPNVEFVGWLPSDLQSYFTFTGGLSASAHEVDAGKALLNFLTGPSAVAIFKTKGLEPASQ
jgi:molybdate transport system substrate-binding protein